MWQIVDYFNNNPDASPTEAISHFEKEFEIGDQVEYLKKEGPRIAEIRMELRPLYGKKMDIKERKQYALSSIEGEVMVEYPPRKGSEAQRETLRTELKQKNEEFQQIEKELKDVAQQISELEDELQDWETKGKNARRLTELLESYIEFITAYCGNQLSQKSNDADKNGNLF